MLVGLTGPIYISNRFQHNIYLYLYLYTCYVLMAQELCTFRSLIFGGQGCEVRDSAGRFESVDLVCRWLDGFAHRFRCSLYCTWFTRLETRGCQNAGAVGQLGIKPCHRGRACRRYWPLLSKRSSKSLWVEKQALSRNPSLAARRIIKRTQNS